LSTAKSLDAAKGNATQHSPKQLEQSETNSGDAIGSGTETS
jgi:hypothetical protein